MAHRMQRRPIRVNFWLGIGPALPRRVHERLLILTRHHERLLILTRHHERLLILT